MGKPVEKKKKKGRPSLLDLQKRSIRLQKQREQQKQKRSPNPNAIPNPYARFHNSSAGRCSARRNPIPEHKPASLSKDGTEALAEASMEDDEDDDEPKQRRKEKKLKLVLHLPQSNTNSSDLTSCATELNGADSKKRVLDTMTKTDGKISVWKTTEAPIVCPGGTSDLGPTTPLPDKKLLNFILDRLQKKDIYGVFSEPVDPEELPDYLDIIKRPMDFSTVRKRLSDSAYKDLEHFEEDIFLISSNAMRYNSPDSIYFRQARSIHELAKKSFENLRQESEGGNREPKVVRRGRPPGTGKNGIKRPVGRPPSERTVSEFSSGASLANALNGNHSSSSFLRSDFHTKRSGLLDQQRAADVSFRSVQFIPSSEAYIFNCGDKSERNEDYSGSALNGFLNYGKKLAVMDDSRRNTYKQCRLLSMAELPVLTALDGERKILFQVGFHIDHTYARSLARFAANLGPIGWQIAAKQIEKVLPLGMKFGPGWIGDIDTHQSHFDHPQPFPPIHSSSTQTNIVASSNGNQRSAKQEALPPNHFRALPPSCSSPIPNFAHEKFPPSLSETLARQHSVLESFISLEGGITVSSNSSSSSSGHEFPPDCDRSFRPEINPDQDINLGILLPNPSKGLWPVVQVDSQQSDLLLQL